MLRYGDYAVIIQAIPDDFLYLNATLNRLKKNIDKFIYAKQSDRWPNKLDFKLVKIQKGEELNYAVRLF